jgi:hypothetical protein
MLYTKPIGPHSHDQLIVRIEQGDWAELVHEVRVRLFG